MARTAFVVFAAVAYAIFLATFLYLVGFVANLAFMPTTIDRGIHAGWPLATTVDLALIAAFALQHSIMARPGAKTAMGRAIPAPIERSVYVLAASGMLILLMALWCPIDRPIWNFGTSALAAALWALFAIGWAIVLWSTFLINHFELFGLSQVMRNWTQSAAPTSSLGRPLFYRLVRHPLYAGFMLSFWATPVMTAGHLLFALAMSGYILIAIPYEERDLVDVFGEEYVQYQHDVGKLMPRRRRFS